MAGGPVISSRIFTRATCPGHVWRMVPELPLLRSSSVMPCLVAHAQAFPISRSVSTLWEASEGIYPYQSLLVQAAEIGQPWWPGLSVYIWILPFLAPMAPKLFRSVATTISVLTTMVPFGVTAVTGCITAAIGPGTPVLPAICPRDNLFFNEWGFHHRRPQVQAFEHNT